MTLTGKVQIVEKDGDKQVVVKEGKPAKTESCTDTERKKVKTQIVAYINAAAPRRRRPSAGRAGQAPATPEEIGLRPGAAAPAG